MRLLSFEYNDQGPWAYNTLKASVEALDAIGYDCYFQVRHSSRQKSRETVSGDGGRTRNTSLHAPRATCADW